jgi:hypothetical protein
MWNLALVCLEIVLVSMQYRCIVCSERTIDSEIVLNAPDGTPRCEAQVEAYSGLFEDSANLNTRYVHDLHIMYHRLKNHFGCTRWNCYVTWAMWNLLLVSFGDSANLHSR